MDAFDRLTALSSRLATLERHAVTLQDAFTDATMKADARDLVDTLRHARAAVDTNAIPDPPALDDLERSVDAASVQLASLGRST
jgi:hypothetical protein